MLCVKIMLSCCMPVQIAVVLGFLDTKWEDRLASREKNSSRKGAGMRSSQMQTAGFCGSLARSCSSDSFGIWQGVEKHIGPG